MSGMITRLVASLAISDLSLGPKHRPEQRKQRKNMEGNAMRRLYGPFLVLQMYTARVSQFLKLFTMAVILAINEGKSLQTLIDIHFL